MPDAPAPQPDGAVEAAVARAVAACGALVPVETPRRLRILIDLLATTPVGVTSVRDPLEAVERHLADALRGLGIVDVAPEGPLADVGSGGGIPGLVLAAARPGRRCVLIESNARKAGFLEEAAAAMGIAVEVHPARSEDVARVGAELRDACAVVVARALAAPPVAVELCLPLVATGGRVILWIGESADAAAIGAAAGRVGGALVQSSGGLAVIEKRESTPAGFPRRAGMAAKRPLA